MVEIYGISIVWTDSDITLTVCLRYLYANWGHASHQLNFTAITVKQMVVVAGKTLQQSYNIYNPTCLMVLRLFHMSFHGRLGLNFIIIYCNLVKILSQINITLLHHIIQYEIIYCIKWLETMMGLILLHHCFISYNNATV